LAGAVGTRRSAESRKGGSERTGGLRAFPRGEGKGGVRVCEVGWRSAGANRRVPLTRANAITESGAEESGETASTRSGTVAARRLASTEQRVLEEAEKGKREKRRWL